MSDSLPTILWLRSWERYGAVWQVRAACLKGRALVDVMVPCETLNHAHVFDIEAAAALGHDSMSLGIDIEDLSSLSLLVEPTDVLRQLHPTLRESRHDIYVGYAGDVPVYFPAALLVRTLWLWSDGILPVLMTPSSLSLYLGKVTSDEGSQIVQALGGLSSWNPGETHLRRLAWLGVDGSARKSWSSVLTGAYRGRLSVQLPRAQLSTWAWGVRVGSGVLACELLTPHVGFWLPEKKLQIEMGRTVRPCPTALPIRRRGTQDSSNEYSDVAG